MLPDPTEFKVAYSTLDLKALHPQVVVSTLEFYHQRGALRQIFHEVAHEAEPFILIIDLRL